MPIIKSNMEIDAAQAISTLNKVQSAFTGYNAALGQVISQSATATKAGKAAVVSFTQVDSAGRKVTTTVREAGVAYGIMNTKVTTASASQRRLAADLTRQKEIADQVAAAVRQVPALAPSRPHRDITTFPGVIDPAKINLVAGAFGKITKEQFNAALAARSFSTAQIAALGKTFDSAQKVTTVFRGIGASVDSFRGKLNEVGKITFATAIYRGISLIQLGLTQGIQTAGEFSKQIGLIQTLATTGSDNFDSWSRAIRSVADEFGRPVTEIAAATYDALSNQIIRTTDDMDKLRVATELARNTNTSVTDSVNVLSSVLNSFGTRAGTAQQVSDKLFKTIDLGRVRINELNGVIGRSGSITQTAGASFDELAGGLIVLTQTGLESAEAATLMNNLFSQLVKPNEELIAQFKKMGFESGPAAIQTLGLAGVMAELHAEVTRTNESISKFFPEMRGMRGAATFGAEGVQKLISAIKALENAQGTNLKATQTLNKNIGQGLADEIQRIQNFFTVDIGQSVLKAVASTSQFFGGFTRGITTLTGLLIELGAALIATFALKTILSFSNSLKIIVAGLAAIGTQIGIANTQLIIFGTTMSSLQLTIAGFAGAFALGFVATTLALNIMADANRVAVGKIRKAYEDNVRVVKETAEKEGSIRTTAFDKSIENMTKSYGRFVARLKAANTEILKSFNETAENIADRLANAFQVFSGIAGANLKKFEREQERSEAFVTELRKSQIKQNDELEQGAFERNMERISKLESAQKGAGTRSAIAAVQARVAQLEKQHKIALDNSDLDEAMRISSEIFSNFEKLQQFNVPINQTILREVEKLRKAEEARKNQIVANVVPIAAAIVKEKLALKDFEDLAKELATFVTKKVQVKEGGLADQYIGNPEKALKDLETLRNRATDELSKLTLKANDPLKLEQAKAALIEINDLYNQQKKNLIGILNTFANEQAVTRFGKAQIELGEKLKKQNDALQAQLLGHKTQLEQNTQLVISLASLIQHQLSGTTSLFQSAGGIFDSLKNFGQGIGGPEQEKVQTLVKEIRDLATKDIPLARTKLIELTNILKTKVPDLKVPDPLNVNAVITFTEALQQMQVALSFIEESQRGIGQKEAGITLMQKEMQTLTAGMDAFIKTADPALALILEKERAIIGDTAAVNEYAKGWNEVALGMAAAARAAENLKLTPLPIAPRPLGQPEARAGGGLAGSQGGFLANFFAGKYAKGTDIIPTMLSRGEFVVRAPMAERYYSQLLAMNSGSFRTPLYKSQGGSVTNNTVGDLHFTVQSSGSTKMAREIMGHIRRAQKQGTGRIS